MLKRWAALLFFATIIFFLTCLVCYAAIPADHKFVINNPDIVSNLIYLMGGTIASLFIYTFNRSNKSVDTLNENMSFFRKEITDLKVDLKEEITDLKVEMSAVKTSVAMLENK